MAIPIPDAMRTLLKSKVMVGDSRPSAAIEIAGKSNDGDLQQIITDINGNIVCYTLSDGINGKYRISNFVTDSQGNEYCIVADSTSGYLKKGTMANNEDYLYKNNPITTLSSIGINISSDITKISVAKTVLQKLADGSVLMFVYESMILSTRAMTVYCYKSSSGNGDDFALLSTVTTESTGTDYAGTRQGLQSAFLTSSGTILVNIVAPLAYDATYRFSGQRTCRSTDGGINWTKVSEFKTSSLEYIGQIVQLKDGTVTFPMLLGSSAEYYFYSTDDGATFTREQVDGIVIGEDISYISGMALHGNYLYGVKYLLSGKSFCYIEDPTYNQMKYAANWTSVLGDFPGTGVPFCWLYENYRGRLVVQFFASDRTYMYMAGFPPPEPITINVKSVEVDMSKGAASQATVVMDNNGGIYSPDKAGEWNKVIWPNAEVTVNMGYGVTQQQVFKGLIDSVSMRSFPAEIEFSCRDMLKKALDQLVNDTYNETTVYTVLYQSQTPEYIFRDLAVKAGWASGNVITGVSGITLESITFAHESFADAFQRLSELTGFEFYSDHEGKLYFLYATDRQPAITEEETVLSGTVYTDIAGVPVGHPMVNGSIVVTSADKMTTYIMATDYTVRLGGSTANAAICRVATGSIPDGATVLVSCVYAHWVFREGEDIFSLDYTISDEEVQARIIVISKDADGVFVRGDEDFNGSRYYDVLAGKVLIVEAGDLASTNAQCLTIAKRVGAASLTKARQANFEVVGNPYIQVGDCIQVIETSSTISEIYRVFSLSHSWSDGVTRTNLQTYHYGYAPI